MTARLALVAIATTTVLVTGCGAAPAQIPESASLAPADAVVYARITVDSESSQWQKAEAVVERVPSVRDSLVQSIEQELAHQSLDWKRDVAPALGDEVVLVVTAQHKPVVLLKPDSEAKLDALLAKSDEETARADVNGYVALAEKDADLAEYRAALERGTIEGDDAFVAGMDALPDESLGLVWVDMAALTDAFQPLLGQATREKLDLGIEWLSAALTADDDGILLSIGARTPGAGDTHYEPKLFRRVPADAVVAVSFGGTQGALDRLEGRVDLDELSSSIEDATGVSLDSLVGALSGEGVLYLRRGSADLPDVTLALAPPDPEKTWRTVDHVARAIAKEANVTVSTSVENGLAVSTLSVNGVTIRYTQLDADTIVVTTGEEAFALLAGDGPKLVDSDAYRRAAEEVGLEGRTKGFVYVDVDHVVPLIESIAGESLPGDVRAGIQAVDSVVLQTSGDGDTTRVTGFVRVP